MLLSLDIIQLTIKSNHHPGLLSRVVWEETFQPPTAGYRVRAGKDSGPLGPWGIGLLVTAAHPALF